MVTATDILLDPVTGDLVIQAGDLVIGASDDQHIQHLCRAYQGYYRQAALAGIGIEDYLNSSGQELALAHLIRVQLGLDYYEPSLVKVTLRPFTVQIDAQRLK